MEYNIIPKQFVTECREAASAEEAIIDFATFMDGDMNTYFQAVAADDTTSTLADQIVKAIRSNTFKAEELSDIFRAISCQQEALGGKFWTTEDIKTQLTNNFDGDAIKIPHDWLIDIACKVEEDILQDCDDCEWDAIDEAIKNSDLSVTVSDIEWDIDKEDFKDEAEYDAVNENLPAGAIIPVSELEFTTISDWLSDHFDYLVKSFNAKATDDSVKEEEA